ncbi:MAG: hypothetical protein WCG66_05790 [bacterium]
MKDFLQGRPLANGTSGRRSDSNVSTTLPPINPPQVHPDSVDLCGIHPESQLDADSIATSSSTSEPQVELVPDANGRIRHIIVTCSCGEKMTLQCHY